MNQSSELLFYFSGKQRTASCVMRSGGGISDELSRSCFLYLNEEDMVAAGVKDMAGCIEAMEEMFKLMKVGNYRMGGANGNSTAVWSCSRRLLRFRKCR